MSDRKTINVMGVNYIDLTLNGSDGTFILEIFADKYLLKIHFKRWALRALADILWKVLKKEKQEIAEAESALRSGE